MPRAWAPTVGRLASKVCIAACDLAFLPSRTRARRSSSFSLPPSRQEPGTRQSSRWTSAVWEPRRPCFFTFAPCSQPGVPGGMTKAAWPREPGGGAGGEDEGGGAGGAELAVDRGDDHVDVGDAAVGRPGLLAVEHPFVLGL